jgi:hypothetical protein
MVILSCITSLLDERYGRDHFKDLGIDGTILKSTLKTRVCLDPCGSGQRPETGSYEHGNQSLGFIKWGEFLDELRNC